MKRGYNWSNLKMGEWEVYINAFGEDGNGRKRTRGNNSADLI